MTQLVQFRFCVREGIGLNPIETINVSLYVHISEFSSSVALNSKS